MTEVTLSEESLKKLGDVIADRIMAAKAKPEPWIGIDELCAIINMKKRTIYNWCCRSDIPRKSGNPLRFKLSAVERWLSTPRKKI